MRDPDLVLRAQRAASALERAWERWRVMHGFGADPLPPVSSYVGYSLEEPWGQPRVVFGIAAEEAENLAAILDGHDCVGPVHAEVSGRRLNVPAQAPQPEPESRQAAGREAGQDVAFQRERDRVVDDDSPELAELPPFPADPSFSDQPSFPAEPSFSDQPSFSDGPSYPSQYAAAPVAADLIPANKPATGSARTGSRVKGAGDEGTAARGTARKATSQDDVTENGRDGSEPGGPKAPRRKTSSRSTVSQVARRVRTRGQVAARASVQGEDEPPGSVPAGRTSARRGEPQGVGEDA
jgi:hypothetical protein